MYQTPTPPATFTPPQADAGPPSIEVGFGSLQRQNRWTVAFRLLLIVPHAIWLMLVSVVGLICVIAGWFAALVLGRLPAPLHRYVSRVVQYGTRVSAYGWLLVDQYPPFRLSATDYPVVVEVAPPGRLNRFAVLFRLVLLVPAVVLTSIASAGLEVIGVFVWLIALIVGRLPRTLSEVICAVIRFQARYIGFASMLTSTYPGGLFGDRVASAAAIAPTSALPAPMAPPRTARLVLSPGARRLMGAVLVLGIATNIASNVVRARLATQSRQIEAHNAVVDAYNDFAAASRQYISTAGQCPVGPARLACAERAVEPLIASADRFDRRIRAIRYPTSAQPDAATLESASEGFAAQLRQTAAASTVPEYVVAAQPLGDQGSVIDQRTRTLVNDLT